MENVTHSLRTLLICITALTLTAPVALADSIPYPNPGIIAPQMTITAQSTGEIYGYFIIGGRASGGAIDTDTVFMFNVTRNVKTGPFFNNQTTTPGTMADFGFANQGDVLVFELFDSAHGNTAATDAAYSTDGINHGYETVFAGGILNGARFPAGIYVGIEDLPLNISDLNYNDDTFVFTNVVATSTPEPSSFLLLGTGVLGMGSAIRRRYCGRGAK